MTANTTGPKPDQQAKRQVAIALSHDSQSDRPPTIVAKGYGELAEKILRLAFANDVKVRQDPDLAQVLEFVEVDCEIPLEAFAAVAEILTYVYAANGRLSEIEETR
ncbi:MAG: flagellar protein FhlB [Rhodospirillaceae bacterium]|jgi:flagellar biosynthesis protein|nr:flagellar protein FhlB [Rhodospirillaceae bacterium]